MPALQPVVQQVRGVGDERPHALGVAEVLVAQRVGVERLSRPTASPANALHHPVLARHDGAQPLAQVVRVEQFADADAAAPADLVLVARADAAAGGADRGARGSARSRLPLPCDRGR